MVLGRLQNMGQGGLAQNGQGPLANLMGGGGAGGLRSPLQASVIFNVLLEGTQIPVDGAVATILGPAGILPVAQGPTLDHTSDGKVIPHVFTIRKGRHPWNVVIPGVGAPLKGNLMLMKDEIITIAVKRPPGYKTTGGARPGDNAGT